MKLFIIFVSFFIPNEDSYACSVYSEPDLDNNKIKLTHKIKSFKVSDPKSAFKITLSKNKKSLNIKSKDRILYMLEPTSTGYYYPTKYISKASHGCTPSQPPLFLKINKKTYNKLAKIKNWICEEEFSSGEDCPPYEPIIELPSSPPKITALKTFNTLNHINNIKRSKLKYLIYQLVSETGNASITVQVKTQKFK